MIFNYYISHLGDLHKTSISLWCKTKTITPDHCPCKNIYMVSNYAITVDLYSGIQKAIIANHNIVADI